MSALHGTSRPPLKGASRHGRISAQQAARLERAAQDAGHTEASFLRLLAFHGIPSAQAVGTWNYDAILTLAKDRSTAARLRRAKPFDGEPARPVQADADDPARAYRVALTRASIEYLDRAAARELASVNACADLASPDVPDAVRAATIEDAAARLSAIVDELSARAMQHRAIEPLLESFRDTLTLQNSHAMPP